MKEFFFRVLNIKQSESGVVFDLLFVQLFLGIATAFLTIVSYTLFLHTYPSAKLPEAYLLIAVTLIAINIFYEKLEHLLSPVIMLRIIALTAIVTLILFWTGMLLIESNWVIFLLLVWGSIIYMLSGYAFWGLVSILFNIRESKRVFSIVGAGDVPAKLIGYISFALLSKLVDLENILWFSIISFGIAIYLVSRFVKKHKEKISAPAIHHHQNHHHSEQRSAEKKTDIISFIFKNKLIFSISLFSIISYNVFNFIDFTFLSEVKTKFENVHELADFMATFFGVGRILSIVLKISITSRVIAKVGLFTSLLITPVALLISCFIIFIFWDDVSSRLYMFGMMALFTEVLRSTIQEPVFFVLFQPLKESLRLKGHMIAKGYMLPPSLIIVGGSLLLLSRAGIPVTILLTVEILIGNIIIWCIVILFIRRSYISTLHSSVKKGVFNSNDVFIPDAETMDILLKKTEEGGSIDVIYALQILEKAGYANIQHLLKNKLSTADIEVKKYAIGRIEQLGITSAVSKIAGLLKDEQDTGVKNAAFNALSKLDDNFIAEHANDLKGLDPLLKKITITQILMRRQFDELVKAGYELNKLMYSKLATERILALDIITELTTLKFDKPIEILLKDDEPEVRKKAMVTVAKLKIERLLPILIDALHDTQDKYLANRALIQYGDNLFDLQKHPEINNPVFLLQFIKIAGKIKGSKSTDFLLQHIHDTAVNRDKAINALWEKKFEAPAGEESKLHNLLNVVLQQAETKIKYFNKVHSFDNAGLLSNSILMEIKNNLLTSLKICSMLYNRNQVNRVLELIELKQSNKLFNGIEILEILLTANTFKEVNKLIEFILNARHVKPQAKGGHDVTDLLQQIVYSPVNQFTSYTKALCIFIGSKNNYTTFLETVAARPLEETEPVIEETRNFVLQRKV